MLKHLLAWGRPQPEPAQPTQATQPELPQPTQPEVAVLPQPTQPDSRASEVGYGLGKAERLPQAEKAKPRGRRKAKVAVKAERKPLDLTASQKEALEYWEGCEAEGKRGFLWWSGGVRAGKSFGALLLAFKHFEKHNGQQGMILGFTQSQLIQVFGAYAETLGEAFGVEVKLNRSTSNPKIRIPDWKAEILIRGANSAGRDKSIQGLTLSFLLVDEVPNLNQETIHQAEARVSGKGGFRVYTSNKQSKYHWTQSYYVRRIEKGQIAGKVIDCNLQDNHHVDASYREERAAEYVGDTLARFVNNEHTLDAPPLFMPKFAAKDQMRMPGKCQKLTALIGHERGIVVVRGRVGTFKRSQLLALDWAIGVENYQDLEPDIIGEHRDTGILINASQVFLARWLRRRGYRVRAVPDGHTPRFLAIIQAACVAGQVRVLETEEVLVQNIETYSIPGEYNPVQPYCWCIEAFASVIRYSGLAAMEVSA